jgi:DNA polymerase-3 subunit delta'
VFFRDIIGQEKAKQQLIAEVNEGRIAHAKLLYGKEGCGNLPLAIAYARYVNCTNRGADDACGRCPSCLKMNNLVHPDVHFTFPVVKKGISDDYIKEWREVVKNNNGYFNLSHWLKQINAENAQATIYTPESDEITKKLSLKSSEALYKVSIIWLPEKMQLPCANKLLKLLEEPPERTLFLLVSGNADMILPTIQSRTQRVNIPGIEEAEIRRALTERFNVLEAQSENIAHLANGNFVKALESIHIDDDNKLYFDLFVSLMRQSYMRNIREMKAWSEKVAGMGRERQKEMLTYCQHMIRENFVYNFHRREMVYMSQDEQNFAVRFAPFINERNVMGLMDELSEAQRHIEQNVNAKMVFFDLSLKVTVLIKQR